MYFKKKKRNRRMEKVSHANTKHKKPGKVVLVTDKIDFKTEFY